MAEDRRPDGTGHKTDGVDSERLQHADERIFVLTYGTTVLGSSRNLLLSALIASAAVALSYGFDVAIGVLALLYLVDMVVLCLFIPERRGAELA